MNGLGIGVHVTAPTVRGTIDAIARLEAAGIETAWMTSGAGTVDPLVVFAAASMVTARIKMGTSIVHTYPRHPLALVQEALAIDQLAPGRLRLGVGPSGPKVIEPSFGIAYERPTTHLREYVTILRLALQTGEVNFEGEVLKARVRLPGATQVEVLNSALRAKSFQLAGELPMARSLGCARANTYATLPRQRSRRAPNRLVAHSPRWSRMCRWS